MNLKIEDVEKLKTDLRVKIKQEMDKQGLSISKLATILGVNRSHVSDIINSDRGSLEKLLLISGPVFEYELKMTAKKLEGITDHQE